MYSYNNLFNKKAQENLVLSSIIKITTNFAYKAFIPKPPHFITQPC